MIEDIRPLKGPASLGPNLGWFFILLAVVAALLLAFFLIKYLKKKRQKGEAPAPTVLKTIEEEALEALASLKGKGLAEKGLFKQYYIELSDILRRYIERRLNILTFDRTTWEIYMEMRQRRVNQEWIDAIKNLLDESDLVKFAKYAPTVQDTDKALDRARSIVHLIGGK